MERIPRIAAVRPEGRGAGVIEFDLSVRKSFEFARLTELALPC